MKTFIINEEEKTRILEMHETATKSLYLSEQQTPNKSYVVKVYDDIVNAVDGPGTNEDDVLKALQQIQNKEDLKITIGASSITYNLFLVTENAKKDFVPFDGPAHFIKDLEKNSDWNLVNLKNFRMLDVNSSSTGLALLTRKL